MKKSIATLAASIALVLSTAADASCYRSGGYTSCSNGNTYSTQSYGGTKSVNGYNSRTGSSWNSTYYSNGTSTHRDSQGNYTTCYGNNCY